jgi:hypothetical protein
VLRCRRVTLLLCHFTDNLLRHSRSKHHGFAVRERLSQNRGIVFMQRWAACRAAGLTELCQHSDFVTATTVGLAGSDVRNPTFAFTACVLRCPDQWVHLQASRAQPKRTRGHSHSEWDNAITDLVLWDWWLPATPGTAVLASR